MYEAGMKHESSRAVNIFPVNVIRINCNLDGHMHSGFFTRHGRTDERIFQALLMSNTLLGMHELEGSIHIKVAEHNHSLA
ncbi:hypothetical protein PR048_019994 [Dryococelus australis]|uniref:Uncharacterized protein n=1 Tax=Dryococelus australis TaxID=614101 RepID=A0ABQ9H530_9NEOP|nr:hypothetical protein PR048_019994 [Dryococelus australis]